MFRHEDFPPISLAPFTNETNMSHDCTKADKSSYLLNLCPSKYIPQKDGLLLLNLEGDVFSSPGMDSDFAFIACSVYLL